VFLLWEHSAKRLAQSVPEFSTMRHALGSLWISSL
jgi:hypothetical protein